MLLNSQNKALVVNGNALSLDYGNAITIDSTRIYAYIATDYKWKSASDSYSVVVPVTVGKQYVIAFTNTSSSLVGTIFRYGFTNSRTPSNQSLSQCVRTTPQAAPNVSLMANSDYLIIQMGATVAATAISNGYITVTEFPS